MKGTVRGYENYKWCVDITEGGSDNPYMDVLFMENRDFMDKPYVGMNVTLHYVSGPTYGKYVAKKA